MRANAEGASRPSPPRVARTCRSARAVEWASNPPASGPHYAQWARWDRHYPQLDRRYWLHNVEHGAIALLYNCPGGCPDVIESLLDVVRAQPVDPLCTGAVRNRMLVAADPLLPADVQVAAVAWDITYTAGCYDPYIKTFAREHYNHAPEDFCFEGIELGGIFIDP